MSTILMLAALIGGSSLATQVTDGATSAPPEPPAASTKLLDGYRDSATIAQAARDLASANPGKVAIDTYGTSAGGRPLIALTLGSATTGRPAILLAAGLDGTHLVGTEIALRLVSELAKREDDLLDRVTIHVIPLANPDAREATLTGPIPMATTLREVDDDRDGSSGEDPLRDIDGDGVLVQMRIKDPPPPFVPTLVIDEKDPRLLRKPDAAKGEQATHLLLGESVDADGDGRFGEDGPGGVDLDKNFPHRWPEFAPDAGLFQLCEAESRALVDFVLAKPELLAAVVYGRHDSLVSVPDSRDMDATGRTPLVYLQADHALYQELGKLYRETTGQTRSTNQDPAGAFWLWLADHQGLLAVASTAWGRPDAPKPPDAPKADEQPAVGPETTPEAAAEGAPAGSGPAEASPPSANPRGERAGANPSAGQATPASELESGRPPPPPAGPGAAPDAAARERFRQARGGRRGGGGPPPGPRQEGAAVDQESAEWIGFLERERGGVGFVPWHSVEHPTFGSIEVGGVDPLAKLNPPSGQLDEIAAKQAAFVASLAGRMPKLEWATPHVSKLADTLWRIETSVTNVGLLPTTTRMARTTRTIAPLVVRVSVPLERIVSGDRVRKLEGIDPGERVAFEWIVVTEADEAIEITAGCPSLGTKTMVIQNGAVTTQ